MNAMRPFGAASRAATRYRFPASQVAEELVDEIDYDEYLCIVERVEALSVA